MDNQQDGQPPKGSGLSEPIIITPQDPGALKISHDDVSPAEPPAQNNTQLNSEPIDQAPKPITQPEPQPEAQPAVEQKPSEWQYQSGQLSPNSGFSGQEKAGPTPPPTPASDTNSPAIKWSASEFVSHEKSASWYVLLIGAVILLAGAIYFVTKDIFSTVVIGLIAIILSVFGALKPRVLDYGIGPDGIQVGNKNFTYETFRSFSLLEDGALPSIQLLPQKRFMVPITMYFAPNDKDHIVGVLGDYLPFEQKDRDLIDKISAKIHF